MFGEWLLAESISQVSKVQSTKSSAAEHQRVLAESEFEAAEQIAQLERQAEEKELARKKGLSQKKLEVQKAVAAEKLQASVPASSAGSRGGSTVTRISARGRAGSRGDGSSAPVLSVDLLRTLERSKSRSHSSDLIQFSEVGLPVVQEHVPENFFGVPENALSDHADVGSTSSRVGTHTEQGEHETQTLPDGPEVPLV